MDQSKDTKRQPAPARRSRRVATVVGGGLVAVLLLAATVMITWWFAQQKDVPAPVDGNQNLSQEEVDVARIFQKTSPSVVSIITTQGSLLSARQGAGTGIVISKDGYVLTNKHVVDQARSVRVVTGSGEQYSRVKQVGVDPLNDIAFLKIQGVDDLPAAELGDSGTVKVGQKVIAIGNSLGQYQNTVTSGIISGKGRPVDAATDGGSSVESLTDLLQTDAAINRGNSGGPLLNSSGQVIGINTAIVSNAQSVGFAIPINAVKGMVRGVLRHGRVEKAYIGLRYIPITPAVHAEYKLPVKQGAYIGGSNGAIVSGGPADKAGLRQGDVIIKINNKTIGENGSLASIISEYVPGETVELTVLRDRQEQQLRLTLEAYQQSRGSSRPESGEE